MINGNNYLSINTINNYSIFFKTISFSMVSAKYSMLPQPNSIHNFFMVLEKLSQIIKSVFFDCDGVKII